MKVAFQFPFPISLHCSWPRCLIPVIAGQTFEDLLNVVEDAHDTEKASSDQPFKHSVGPTLMAEHLWAAIRAQRFDAIQIYPVFQKKSVQSLGKTFA